MDHNTKYFCGVIRGRRKKNEILSIRRADGEWTTDNDNDEIKVDFVDYFQLLLGSSGDVQQQIQPDVVMEGNLLNSSQMEALLTDVTDLEVKNALWDIEDARAPGVDGYSSPFFKRCWNVVGGDVIAAVHDFSEVERS
ncbi:hypothetical protein Droror1_Dr00025117 [Drosera rotundifolia]